MISDAFRKWLMVIYVTLSVANPQFPMLMSFPPFPPIMSQFPSMSPAMPPFPPIAPMAPPPPHMVQMMPPPPPNYMQPPFKPIQMMQALPPNIPFHMPMPMGIGIAVIPDNHNSPRTTTTTTTTTTTRKPFLDKNGVLNIPGNVDDIAIALPMPMPMGMPMGPLPAAPPPLAVPQAVHFGFPGVIPSYCKINGGNSICPPCPPCSCNPCTPSFFSYCSPCHHKCRCRKREDTPIPLPPQPPIPMPRSGFALPYPMPLPMSGPAPESVSSKVLMPYASKRVHSRRHSKRGDSTQREYDNDWEDSSYDYWKSNSDRKTRLRSRANNYRNHRKNHRDSDIDFGGNILAKPELNYIGRDGKVKIKKNLNKEEAFELMHDDDYDENVYIHTDDPFKDGRNHSIVFNFNQDKNYKYRNMKLKPDNF